MCKIPRYFIDKRCGIIAVRNREHEKYDEEYQGLNSDTPDVVDYRTGDMINGEWVLSDDKITKMEELCKKLNREK